MIKEFALEPVVLAASFRDFTYFIEKFGIVHGRVISAFPRKWKKLVYEAAQANLRGSLELRRIEERLKNISDDVLMALGREGGDGTQPWLARAVVEHAHKPFAAIIASGNPDAHADVLLAAELDETEVRFQASGQRHIARTATEIVDCVGLLLDVATTVKLIDPYFDPTKARWRRMLSLVMARLARNGQAGVTLEIHRVDDALPANLKALFDPTIPKILPPDLTVEVFLHPEKAMHNRFVLTNIGGAAYKTGLDDNEDGNSTPEDVVVLLGRDVFNREWATFSGKSPFLTF